MAEQDLSFVNCPNCGSLIPSTAIRCRMCGVDLGSAREQLAREASRNSGERERDYESEGIGRVRVKQKTLSLSRDAMEDFKQNIGDRDERSARLAEGDGAVSSGFAVDKGGPADKSGTGSRQAGDKGGPQFESRAGIDNRAQSGNEQGGGGQFRFRGRDKDAVFADDSRNYGNRTGGSGQQAESSDLTGEKGQRAANPPRRAEDYSIAGEDKSSQGDSPRLREIPKQTDASTSRDKQQTRTDARSEHPVSENDDRQRRERSRDGEDRGRLRSETASAGEHREAQGRQQARPGQDTITGQQRPQYGDTTASAEARKSQPSAKEGRPVSGGGEVSGDLDSGSKSQDVGKLSAAMPGVDKAAKINREGAVQGPVGQPDKPEVPLKTLQKKMALSGWCVHYPDDSSIETIELHSGKFLITGNRLRDNDLVIDHPSISSPHAIINSSNGEVVVLDLMSEKGTFLKHSGEPEFSRISGQVVLSHGDRVRFGDYEIVLCLIPTT